MSMKRIVAGAVVVCLMSVVATFAEESAPKGPVKGDTGEIVGAITKMDGGRITVKGEQSEMALMPFWRGGAPAAGGGYDKDMMKKLAEFKVGDKVKVSWIMEEHARIKSIEKAP